MASKDLTCNETMANLDDGDNNLVNTKRFCSIPPNYVSPSTILISSRVQNSMGNISHAPTVKDIVSGRVKGAKVSKNSIGNGNFPNSNMIDPTNLFQLINTNRQSETSSIIGQQSKVLANSYSHQILGVPNDHVYSVANSIKPIQAGLNRIPAGTPIGIAQGLIVRSIHPLIPQGPTTIIQQATPAIPISSSPSIASILSRPVVASNHQSTILSHSNHHHNQIRSSSPFQASNFPPLIVSPQKQQRSIAITTLNTAPKTLAQNNNPRFHLPNQPCVTIKTEVPREDSPMSTSIQRMSPNIKSTKGIINITAKKAPIAEMVRPASTFNLPADNGQFYPSANSTGPPTMEVSKKRIRKQQFIGSSLNIRPTQQLLKANLKTSNLDANADQQNPIKIEAEETPIPSPKIQQPLLPSTSNHKCDLKPNNSSFHSPLRNKMPKKRGRPRNPPPIDPKSNCSSTIVDEFSFSKGSGLKISTTKRKYIKKASLASTISSVSENREIKKASKKYKFFNKNELKKSKKYSLIREEKDKHLSNSRDFYSLTDKNFDNSICRSFSSGVVDEQKEQERLQKQPFTKPSSSTLVSPEMIPFFNELKQIPELGMMVKYCDVRGNFDAHDELMELFGHTKTEETQQPSASSFVPTKNFTYHVNDNEPSTSSSAIKCPIFRNQEEFLNESKSAHLLSKACTYFADSQRLKTNIESYLKGCLLHRRLKEAHMATYENESNIFSSNLEDKLKPLSELKLSYPTKNDQMDEVFKKLKLNVSDDKSRPNSIEENLLKEIGLAKSKNVDNLPHSAESPPISSKGRLKSNKPSIDMNPHESFEVYQRSVIADSVYMDHLLSSLPTSLQNVLTQQNKDRRGRKRSRKKSRPRHDFFETEEDEPPLYESKKRRKTITIEKMTFCQLKNQLETMYSNAMEQVQSTTKICTMILSKLLPQIEQQPVDNHSSQNSLFNQQKLSCELKKSVPYNSNKSIIVNPSPSFVEELFKQVPLKPYNYNLDQGPNNLSADANTQNLLQRENDKIMEDDSFLLMGDLSMLHLESAHSSEVAFQRLKERHTELVETKSATNILNRIPDETTEQFKPSLFYRFPNTSVEQEKFLEDRATETQELGTTLLNLMESRKKLLKQSIDSMIDLESSNPTELKTYTSLQEDSARYFDSSSSDNDEEAEKKRPGRFRENARRGGIQPKRAGILGNGGSKCQYPPPLRKRTSMDDGDRSNHTTN